MNKEVENIVIDESIANILFNIEIENLAPTDEISDEDYKEFMTTYVGKTLNEYAKHRNPDDPEEQLELAFEFINYTKN